MRVSENTTLEFDSSAAVRFVPPPAPAADEIDLASAAGNSDAPPGGACHACGAPRASTYSRATPTECRSAARSASRAPLRVFRHLRGDPRVSPGDSGSRGRIGRAGGRAVWRLSHPRRQRRVRLASAARSRHWHPRRAVWPAAAGRSRDHGRCVPVWGVAHGGLVRIDAWTRNRVEAAVDDRCRIDCVDCRGCYPRTPPALGHAVAILPERVGCGFEPRGATCHGLDSNLLNDRSHSSCWCARLERG